MSTRVRTVVFAVAFGLLATLGTALYMNSLRAEIVGSGTPIPVLTAKVEIPAGTPAKDLTANGMVEEIQTPKRYAALGAIGSLDDYEGRVMATAVGPGEQLTAAKFRSAEKSELTQRVPDGKIAVAVPTDEVVGVGVSIQEGDRIVVLATFEPGPGGADITRVLLKDIEVLAASADEVKTGMGGASMTKKTLTLAVTPAEAEKLVFAEEKGKIWMGLVGIGEGVLPETGGETMERIF